MTRKRFSASWLERLDVGSSMMSTRAFTDSALAISTSCWCPMVSVPTSAAGSTSSPTAWRNSRALRCCRALSISPKRRCSRPRKMFAATSRLSARFSSWWMSAMPCASASWTVRISTARPSIRTSPESGRCTPARIFISVLLPAPFSPITASTSPRATVRLTPFNARTPGKDLVSWRTSSSGALMASRDYFAGPILAFRSAQNSSTLSFRICRAGMSMNLFAGMTPVFPFASSPRISTDLKPYM